ncbi:MAG: GAF domain-containing sensor histidine kinase [Anaerolineae bacterium]
MAETTLDMAGASAEKTLAWSEAILYGPDVAAIAAVAATTLPELVPLALSAIALCPAQAGAEWRVVGQWNGDMLDGAEWLGQGLGLALLRAALQPPQPGLGLHHPQTVLAAYLDLPFDYPSELLAFPLRTHRSDLGVLLAALSPAADAPRDVLKLQALAAHLSLGLENAALYSQTAQREREMRLISETGRQLTQLQSLSELIPQLVREVSQTFNYDSMGLLLVDPLRGDLVVRDTIGLGREQHLGFRVPITDRPEGGITGRVAHLGISYLAPDVREEAHYIRTVEHARSELAIPLKIQERVIGVLDVQSVNVGGLTVKDKQLLTTLADQLAVALDNARLYEELARAHDELRQKAEQLQQLLARTVQIQEDERHRIAADIHDGVIQLVYGALYQVEGATQRLPIALTEARGHLHEVSAFLNQAIAETHKAIYNLWPSSLDEMGLLPSVEAYLVRFEQSTGIHCELHVEGEPVRFNSQARITIYRIMQEAFNNVRKHAGAESVEVIFRFAPTTVEVSIRDDGHGFKPDTIAPGPGHGLGLIAMRERVQTIGGTFDIRSGRSGTWIVLEFSRDRVRRVEHDY